MNKEILKQLRKQANDFQIIKGWKVGGSLLPAYLSALGKETLPLVLCL